MKYFLSHIANTKYLQRSGGSGRAGGVERRRQAGHWEVGSKVAGTP